jgi:hypothetical protein
MKPIFHGEAMLRRVTASGEATFILDDTAALQALAARQGRTGQRFAMVLVPIGEDERPLVETPTSVELRWGALDYLLRLLTRMDDRKRSQQAAVLCQDPGMAWYLYAANNELPAGVIPTPRTEDVVRWMRGRFGIESRAELDREEFLVPWHRFMQEVGAWATETKAMLRDAI